VDPSLSKHTNDPRRGEAGQRLIPVLREYLRERLPDYMVPSAFVMLDALPLTPNGKVDRKNLPSSDSRRPVTLTGGFVAPGTNVERQIARVWQDVLGVDTVGVHDNFFDLGGHSLLAVRMFAQLEKQLRVTLPLATLFQVPTIEGLAALIRGSIRPALRHSLVPIQPAGNRPPVFGMPGVGGNVLNYHALARLLGSDQPFYGLQSRGLDGLEEPLMRIEDIAAEFLREIREVQPEGPYYLVGSCMGGVVAYEMAQQLCAAGQQVGFLGLLDAWPSETDSSRRLRIAARSSVVLGFMVGRLRLYLETLARLHGREQLWYLLGRLKLLTEIIAQRDLFRSARRDLLLEAVTRANLLAFQQYKPRVYPGPVVLFRAEGRKVAPAADYRLAWRELTTAGLKIYGMPGENSGLMLTEPHVRLVAAQLKTCLERVQASAPPVESVQGLSTVLILGNFLNDTFAKLTSFLEQVSDFIAVLPHTL
jgi:thioesterase domain-containing protein/acyl carrier protein